MTHKYTDEQFIAAIQESKSIREALSTLGLKAAGGNYKTFHKRKESLNIDTSHFTGQLWSKGQILLKQHKPATDYLYLGSNIGSYALKNKLLMENYFQRICSKCSLSTWLDNPIPLELDHINGISDDNRLENLRLLCPNCHALTPTYRGKNKKRA